MQFFETSAKTNYNVNETFTYLTREILMSTEGNTPNNTDKKTTLKLDGEKPDSSKKDKKCCK